MIRHAHFVIPSIRSLAPAAVRRLPIYLAVVSWLTLLSGDRYF